MTVDKDYLIELISEKTLSSKEDTKKFLDAFGKILKKELLENDRLPPKEREVRFSPYGKFRTRVIKPKIRKIAGEEIEVKKQYKIAFKPFKAGTKKF